MKKRILSCFLALVLALSLLPMSVLAAGSGEGLASDDPMVVPADAMVIKNNTYYGVSKTWFANVNPDKGTLYVSLQIPNTVENIANDAFRDNYTGDKAKYGAVNANDKLGQCKVAAIDFSQATNLTTIGYQAAMYCSDISGVLDLSNTKVETIEKNAFSGCTGLTGVILPNTLEVLGTEDGTSGSVFKDCTGLEFLRTSNSGSDVIFELPTNLRVIGKDTFKDNFRAGTELKVHIPASVEIIGSQAFYNAKFSQIYIDRQSDYTGYDLDAFKYVGLLILPNNEAYKSTGSFTRTTKTYPVALKFMNGSDLVGTQLKLYGQSIQYTKDSNGVWYLDEEYSLPDPGNVTTKPGYDAGWKIYGDTKVLTNTSKVSGWQDAELKVSVVNDAVVAKPTVEYMVNGSVDQNAGSGVPKLTVKVSEDTPGSVGVQVTHPLATEEAKERGTYVYFEYCWWDEKGGSVNGPRSETEPDLFSTAATSSSYDRVFTDQNVIPIRNTDDIRTDGDYYLVEIFGYYVENNGTPKRYYKSGHNFIAGDNATDRSFVMNVDVVDTTPVTITPANMTIYMGGDSYEGVVDGDGNSATNNSLPEPLFKITMPKSAGAFPEDLTFINGGKKWTVEVAGIDIVTKTTYYRLVPGEGQDPVRVQFTDENNVIHVNDKFDPSEIKDLYTTYHIDVYPGENNLDDVKASINGKEYPVSAGTGTLTIRAVADNKPDDDPTIDVIDENSLTKVETGKAVAVAPKGTTYTLNDTGVLVANAKPSLLFDHIINDEQHDRTGALEKKINQKLGAVADNTTRHYEIMYLDLVDANNGNAWIKASESMDIYWGYPEGTDQNTKFTILHFPGLHRDDSTGGSSGYEVSDIEKCEVDDSITVENTSNGIKFSVEPGGFSPFALVYEKTQTPPDPITRYRIEASAGPGGSINPEGIVRVSEGGNQHFTITPDEGYKILDVVVDGKSVGPVDEYTFKNVREWHTIEVTFTKLPANPDDSGVSDWLDTENHMAYLNGYPGEVFGPQQNMTRAEAAQMFYNLLLEKNVPITVSFTDVNDNAWYAKAVNTLASLGMIQGVEGNRFEPDRSITRAEFTAIAMRFTDGDTKGENIFSDVHPDQWFYDEVVGSIQYGWINGYEDDTFRPNNTITRAEVATITNRMLDREADRGYVDAHTDELRLFSDVDKGYWAYYTIVEASNAHEYTKDHNNEFWK